MYDRSLWDFPSLEDTLESCDMLSFVFKIQDSMLQAGLYSVISYKIMGTKCLQQSRHESGRRGDRRGVRFDIPNRASWLLRSSFIVACKGPIAFHSIWTAAGVLTRRPDPSCWRWAVPLWGPQVRSGLSLLFFKSRLSEPWLKPGHEMS